MQMVLLFPMISKIILSLYSLQVIEKFIRFAHRKRYNGENMTYEASTFLYAIAVAIFALGGMVGGFTGGWIANKSGRYVFLLELLVLTKLSANLRFEPWNHAIGDISLFNDNVSDTSFKWFSFHSPGKALVVHWPVPEHGGFLTYI